MGDVQLFSGCADEQTSADVTNLYGAPGGAMTNAFLDLMEEGRAWTYHDFLKGLQQKIRERGFAQVPQLSASQCFDLNDIVGDHIHPNRNQYIGREVRKQKHRLRPLAHEDPLLGMLDDVGTFLFMDAMLGDPLGMYGGDFGGDYGSGMFGDDMGGFGGDGDFDGGFDF